MYKFRRAIEKLIDLFFAFVKSGDDYARYKGVKVGKNCRVIIKEFGTEPWLISIGDNVTITDGVRLLTHDGSTWLVRDEKGRRFLYKKIVIGSNVFIGIDSIILPGVIIGDNVIVAAGSVVAKSIPSGSIVGGNPAKIIGSFEEYEKDVLLNYISDKDIDKKRNYKDRINSVVDMKFKDFLTKDEKR